MKIYNFFIKKIFLKRIIFSLMTVILFVASSYSSFRISRGLINLYLGYKQYQPFKNRNTYVQRIYADEIEPDDELLDEKLPIIYNYLDKNFKYAGYIDGYESSLKSNNNFEIQEAYLMGEYYKTRGFDLSEGKDLYFDFKIDGSEDIPILVGYNLAKDYPVGSRIQTDEYPGFEGKKLTYKVVGVLKSNAYNSWVHMLDNKNYYNYSIIVPIIDAKKSKFIMDNYLHSIFLFDTNKEETDKLSRFIREEIKYNVSFVTIEETANEQIGYAFEAISILGIIELVIFILLTLISSWIFTKFIKLLIKDITINIVAGLDYRKLEKMFFVYLFFLLFLAFLITVIVCAIFRRSFWIIKDSLLVTNGFLGMIGTDYISLLISFVVNIVIALIITKISMIVIKRIPISIGVLG